MLIPLLFLSLARGAVFPDTELTQAAIGSNFIEDAPAAGCIRFSRLLHSAFGNEYNRLHKLYGIHQEVFNFFHCFDEHDYYRQMDDAALEKCRNVNYDLLASLETPPAMRLLDLLEYLHTGRVTAVWNGAAVNSGNAEEHAILLWWIRKLPEAALRNFLRSGSPFFADALRNHYQRDITSAEREVAELKLALVELIKEGIRLQDLARKGQAYPGWLAEVHQNESEVERVTLEMRQKESDLQYHPNKPIISMLNDWERSMWVLRLSTAMPKAMTLWDRELAEHWYYCPDPNTIITLDLHNLRDEKHWQVGLVIGQAPANLTMNQILTTAKPANVPVMEWLSEEAILDLLSRSSPRLNQPILRALLLIHRTFLPTGKKPSIFEEIKSEPHELQILVAKEYLLASPAHIDCFKLRVEFLGKNPGAWKALCKSILRPEAFKDLPEAKKLILLLEAIPKPPGVLLDDALKKRIISRLPKSKNIALMLLQEMGLEPKKKD